MASTLGTKSTEKFTQIVNQKLFKTHTLTKEIHITKFSKKENVAIQPMDNIKAQKL